MLLFSGILLAQSQGVTPKGGAYDFNPSQIACVTPENYELYREQVTKNTKQLVAANKRLYAPNRASQQVAFEWPVAQAEGFDYNSFWSISNYVDHNDATGQLSDWNCGTRTYDTSGGYDHQGVDIFTWPFTWTMVDNDQALVVAAAAGQIVYKNDGSYDRNCSFNNDQWNAVFVEHSDGSVAWYGHMKEGSLTSKNVGDTVATGETLGVVASSGNSTGPHLHFEVYDAGGNLIDPYAGPCNDTAATSWWADQKAYTNPGINAVITHSAPPEFNFNNCPTTEVLNDTKQVDANGTLVFASYFRDQTIGESADYKVTDPNGNIYTQWSQTFENFYTASYWYWEFAIDETEGEWIFEVSYADDIVTQTFTVGELSVTEVDGLGLAAFPNPAQHTITIQANTVIEQIALYDIQGRLVQSLTPSSFTKDVDISRLPSGVYFAAITAEQGSLQQTIRLIKK